ncbi:peptide chain release factor 1-like [Schistocerca gregaria]|uniref:peptide chain release factor 1-like n=1 Tax=Schistocerca gregaria TaxID=7010 RepID=UPI00211F1612|nr:peptide chain release factor 1-like [Schistocerca gregaria]
MTRSLKEEVDMIEEYDRQVKLAEELKKLASDAGSCAELREMAEQEYGEVMGGLRDLENSLLLGLLPKDAADEGSAIIEIRPGTGGLEAGLFAMDMYKMYQRYAQRRSWSFETLSLTESDVDGLREATACIKGDRAYGMLKYEVGVHRVQRIPETETLGRVHTSTTTVAVLPEAEDINIDLRPQNLRIETKRSSGAGGQHVNTTDSAVRITHIPTGIAVCIQDERSQHSNKQKALKILKARLYDLERTRLSNQRAESRRLQIRSGDRHERIRTYNFQQDRITDHRVGLTLHGMDRMMNGEYLDAFIEELMLASQAEALEGLCSDMSAKSF